MWFSEVNEQIAGYRSGDCLGTQHTVRAGVEYKPIEDLALRAGYSLATSGTRFLDYDGNTLNPLTHSVSLGVGYDSPKSFFCDLGARLGFLPTTYTQIYGDYYNDRVTPSTGALYCSPEIESTKMLLNIVATIGWRF